MAVSVSFAAIGQVVPVGVRVLDFVVHAMGINLYEIFPFLAFGDFGSPIRSGLIVDAGTF